MFSFRYRDLDIAHKSGFNEAEEGDDYSKHIHYYHELLYFVRGNVIYNIGAVRERPESGDLLVISEGQSHFPEVVTEGENYERYVVKFPDSAIPEYLRAKLRNVRPFFGKLKEGMRIFKKFDIYFSHYGAEDMYTLCLCDIVKLLVDVCRDAAPEKAKRSGLAERMKEYIAQRHGGDIKISTENRIFEIVVYMIKH